MKKASSGYNTTLKMNEKEKLRGCKQSITWYHVFQDIWFHFNHTFLREHKYQRVYKAERCLVNMSTIHNVDTGRNHDGRLEC